MFETASAPVQVFKTSFPAQIEKGLKETRVLLHPVTPVDGTLPVAGMPLVLRDAASLSMPTGVELTVKSDKVAKGLEVFIGGPRHRARGSVRSRS